MILETKKGRGSKQNFVRYKDKNKSACDILINITLHFQVTDSSQQTVTSSKSATKAIEKDTAQKVSKYGVISGLYFPVFGLNTEITE